MPTNRPAAIAAFPRDRTNAFGDVRHVLLSAVARCRDSEVKRDDLLDLLQWAEDYCIARNGDPNA